MQPLWRPAYIALGSNLNNPEERIGDAFTRLATLTDSRLELRSRLYFSRPMGPQDQPDFINAVAGMLTLLSARELLEALLGIERAMGRDRQERWGPRLIDLDLIWMSGRMIDEPGLTLPHPGVSVRNFVLYPLSDVAPTLMLPGRGTVLDLKARVSGEGISVLKQPVR